MNLMNFIHRDLNPNNLLVDSDEIYIADFGLAEVIKHHILCFI